MSAPTATTPEAERDLIRLEDVSKFYGEVLGINRVHLNIAPGITSLVGPNGSGKSTLMNVLAGLLHPTQGRVRVAGVDPRDHEQLGRLVGYCTQVDAFPPGATGRSFVQMWLRLQGYAAGEALARAEQAIARVGLEPAAGRRVAGYSKGMRQRIKLAQALAHDPRVLILDEPLNGLDPMARAEVIALFRQLADEGRFVLVSSHILHEVDEISDSVVLLNGGYVVAEGSIRGVREEMTTRPAKVFVRCDRPKVLASRLFMTDGVIEASLVEEERGVLLSTRDASSLHRRLNEIVLEEELEVEAVAPADDDVAAVYRYLIEDEKGASS